MLLLLGAMSGTASACSCVVSPPTAEALAAATVVFQGRVHSFEAAPAPREGAMIEIGGNQRAVFEVDAWWKGDGADRVTVRV